MTTPEHAASPSVVIAKLVAAGATVATAESLTGGAVCAALVSVPGASAAVLGGVIAYTPELKHALLGVDPEAIRAAGVVSSQVASAMAEGVRRATGATYGVATTGAAGPEPHDGAPPGTVWIAVAGPSATRAERCDVAGDRDAVRAGAVARALGLLERVLADHVTAP